MHGNNKKIVFFDIDGTIYLYGRGIPDDTRKAIENLRENGHMAMLCTGRTTSMIFPEILDVGFDGVIAGAGTYVKVGEEKLYEEVLDNDKVCEIIEDMRKFNIMAIPEGVKNIYFDKDLMREDYISIYKLYKENVGRNVVVIDDLSEIIASKVSGVANYGADVDSLVEKYKNDFNVVFHGKGFIEMIPKDYSKAKGIESVLKYTGIEKKNTYAFGDGMNDFEMLKYVKYGVAMGNSSDEFKSNFKYVTDDFDKGGIYKSLKGFELIWI